MKPVLLIGAGRSGTKLLRDLLAESPEITRVPYDVSYVWRHKNEGCPHDEIKPEDVDQKDVEWIRRNIYKLQDKKKSSFGNVYLVEKSVPNSLRPLLLYKVFPEAYFIQIVRDGRAVTESAIRMWSAKPETQYLLEKLRYFPWSSYRYAAWYFYNRLVHFFKSRPAIWGPRYKGISDDVSSQPLHVVCARQWRRCIEVADVQLKDIPRNQQITIRYEDLVKDENTVLGICDFLGIDSGPILQAFKDIVRTDNNTKWESALTESQILDIKNEFNSMPKALKEYCFGKENF